MNYRNRSFYSGLENQRTFCSPDRINTKKPDRNRLKWDFLGEAPTTRRRRRPFRKLWANFQKKWPKNAIKFNFGQNLWILKNFSGYSSWTLVLLDFWRGEGVLPKSPWNEKMEQGSHSGLFRPSFRHSETHFWGPSARGENKEGKGALSFQYWPYEANLPHQYFGIGWQDFWGEALKLS